MWPSSTLVDAQHPLLGPRLLNGHSPVANSLHLAQLPLEAARNESEGPRWPCQAMEEAQESCSEGRNNGSAISQSGNGNKPGNLGELPTSTSLSSVHGNTDGDGANETWPPGSLLILSGPAGSGKSCYLEQLALLHLLSQIGASLPAGSAQLTPMDALWVLPSHNRGVSRYDDRQQQWLHAMEQGSRAALMLIDEPLEANPSTSEVALLRQLLEKRAQMGARTVVATRQAGRLQLVGKLGVIQAHLKEPGNKASFVLQLGPGPSSDAWPIENEYDRLREGILDSWQSQRMQPSAIGPQSPVDCTLLMADLRRRLSSQQAQVRLLTDDTRISLWDAVIAQLKFRPATLALLSQKVKKHGIL